MSDERLTWDELMKRKGVKGAKPNPPEPAVEPVPTPASAPAVSAKPAAPTSSELPPVVLRAQDGRVIDGSTEVPNPRPHAPTKEQEHAAEVFVGRGSSRRDESVPGVMIDAPKHDKHEHDKPKHK